ncbi:sulfatase-like hydrolase/transferase [uncultured Lutibacter sp.]|uniref:sulfatase-like hydrolase/transferase n=1 Tax=uncultured Lutibacter sp. TaxID=437739 RepID=UPI002638A1B8|nr:sulfatase-like hydrolase/transferase [uncultured Lutibacter sp.]
MRTSKSATSNNFINYIIVLMFIFIGTSCNSSSKSLLKNKENNPPNIILIMVDDLGYESIGCYGGTSYKTPNIDKLASTGVLFNQAYAQPLCTNTRVKLMTGKYNYRNWTSFGILDPSQKTFGHLMQDAGYETCIVGKWQLQSYDPIDYPGAEYRRGTGMDADKAGFDEYCLWHTGHTEDKGSRFANPTILQNGKILENTNGKYGPDIFSDYLNEFVSRQSEKPFFVYYPMALTHNPFSPTPRSKEWNEENKRFEDKPVYFKDMVEYTDKIVGDIVKNLDKNGLRDNTLILFYSDNGTNQQIYSKMGNKIVRGGKGLTIKTGIKVPFIANFPGFVKTGETDEYIDAIDFLPSILEVAGKKVPTGFHTDGESFVSVLKGENNNRRDWIYMSYNPKPGVGKQNFYPSEFVFNKNYKLYGDGRFYNLDKDELETKQLIKANYSTKEIAIKQRFEKIIDSLKKYPSFGEIERLDTSLDTIISKHARIDLVAQGFNWSEGPVWQPKGQKLIFSDVPENKAYQWNDISGLSVYLSPSGSTPNLPNKKIKGSNGITLDNQGNLILCQTGDRIISRLVSRKDSSDVVFEPIATEYNGKKFNSPNDLVYDSNGNLYFTDPTFGLGKGKKSEIGFNGVYFLDKNGKVKLVSKDVKLPNGIEISNDGKILYVADSDKDFPKVWAFDIVEEGVVKNKRIFFDATKLHRASISKQCPDGMKIDKDGNLFLAGPDGVLILSPTGKHLGTIRTNKNTGNCAFSDDGRFLFITCDDLLLRVNLRPYEK